ncbi:MAG: HRDC domain-containing protein [Verrucomicrobiales bacterium]|nr:HRDC domain-containing protein [Verrucomicrobiales bacterium]
MSSSDEPPTGPSLLPVPPAPEYELIETQEALQQWVDAARAARSQVGDSRACLDTEADSLHHYREKICLLQVTCGGKFALVDPLAIDDVTSLFALLDEGELWFHGADYDLSMLARTYDWRPRVMRDTQIAARLAGHRQFGLAALVKTSFGLELSKASQKADWSQRPLPEVMRRYAIDDVRFLLSIADQLMEALKGENRIDWFLESCETLQRDVDRRLSAPKEDPWRVQGCGRLHPKGLAFLKSAWHWRECVAAERDIPCFRVMSNKQLIGYAEQFEKDQPLHPPGGWRPRWKKAFTDLVREGSSQPSSEWPRRLRRERGRFTEEEKKRVDALCAGREQLAGRLGIESSLLGSRATLEQVVASGSSEGLLMNWQRVVLSPILEPQTLPAPTPAS